MFVFIKILQREKELESSGDGWRVEVSSKNFKKKELMDMNNSVIIVKRERGGRVWGVNGDGK